MTIHVLEKAVIVKNGKAALSGADTLRETDLRIEGGIITEIGQDLSGSGKIVDAKGLWVFPGGIDPHVHFYDPGYTYKEDFFHGTSFAASGGITTVIDMPCTSLPPVTSARNLKEKLSVLREKAVIDFGLYGGVSSQVFESGYESAMEELSEGVLGFKCYALSGMESFGRVNHFQFLQILKKGADLGIPVLLHAEDADFVGYAAERMMREGNTPRHYYQSRPEIAEILAVETAIELTEQTGGDLHIVHIGTATAALKLEGTTRVTGETCPHYLAFSLEDFEEQGPLLKVAPVIKSAENKQGLWELLSKGTIDFVASDHAPGTEEEKSGENIWKNSSGIAGCGTMYPYLLSEGFLGGKLSLNRFLEIISENAAKRYGLFSRKGSLAAGKDADFVLINPEGVTTIEGARFLSRGKLTPFEGHVFNGEITGAWVRGEQVFSHREGILTSPGSGKYLTRSV
jgi:allantoinase